MDIGVVMITGEEMAVLGIFAQAKSGAITDAQKTELMALLGAHAQEVAQVLIDENAQVSKSAQKTALALKEWASDVALKRRAE
jgi:hypothetical protein